MSGQLHHLLNTPMPGGCPDCNAVQTLIASGGIYVLTIEHDDTCPELARREKRNR